MPVPIDTSLLADSKAIPMLTWLGRKRGWLTLYPLAKPNLTWAVNMPPNDGRLANADWVRLAQHVNLLNAEQAVRELTKLQATAAAFANGLKAFYPTMKQCEAMMNVTLDLPTTDYRQPYPAILYRYPTEFCAAQARKWNVKKFPTTTLCFHDTDSAAHQGGVVGVYSFFSRSDAVTALVPHRDGQTMEDTIRQRVGFEQAPEWRNDPEWLAEFEIGEVLQRLALNFSLLMTHYKTVVRPLDPARASKHQKMATDKDPETAARGRRLAASEVGVISFDQEVLMYEERRQQDYRQSPPTGATVGPHWRKGHWRMQPHGPQNSLRKRKFIRPIFVREDLFVGVAADTATAYVGRDRPQDGVTGPTDPMTP